MDLHTFQKYLKPLLLFQICLLLISCNSDEETETPSLDNDFLGKDYFYYEFDGMEEYESWDRIFVDTREEVDPSTIVNVISGPNARRGFGELGRSESDGFSSSYYFWLPIKESQIQNIALPLRSETTRFIGFPKSSTDSNLLFQLSLNINEENNSWRSLNSEEWSNLSSEDFLQKNYHLLENITLLDSSDMDVNIYKIEGEFQVDLNYDGTNLLKAIYGKYRIELLVYK